MKGTFSWRWLGLAVLGFGVAILALAVFNTPQAAWADDTRVIIYVKADATGANNGTSWADAYAALQSALDWTNAHGGTAYEIWVAAGVYYPDQGARHVSHAMTETFTIARNNVQVYGGFAGTEALRDDRDWNAHVTVLSGDIDSNDTTDANHITGVYSDIVGSNAYHVLYLDGETTQPITGTTVIDGFTITAGYADGGSSYTSGGGLLCRGSGSGHACSPTLTHLTFSGNHAVWGGGIFNAGQSGGVSSPILSDVIFSGNLAVGGGGGMCNAGGAGTSSPVLTDVTFSGNRANGLALDRNGGGGMYNDGSVAYSMNDPVLVRVTFIDNWGVRGGGMYNDGGESGDSSPVLTGVVFSGNQAYRGGGMYNTSLNYGISSPVLTNVIFSGNQAIGATGYGGGIYNEEGTGNASPLLTNVLVSGNRAGSSGGGMYNYDYGSPSRPVLANVTFSGNWAGSSGGAMYNYNAVSGQGRPELVNCILWGNVASSDPQISNNGVTPVVTYSDVQWPGGVYTGTGNLNRDPLFVAPITATLAPTTTGNYRLQINSPAIDVGNPLSVTVATDLDGNARLHNGKVDLGPYEMATATTFTLIVATSGYGSGQVTPTVGMHSYSRGAVVTLAATPGVGSFFAGWSGAADCADGKVTMDANKACTAAFAVEVAKVFLPLAQR